MTSCPAWPLTGRGPLGLIVHGVPLQFNPCFIKENRPCHPICPEMVYSGIWILKLPQVPRHSPIQCRRDCFRWWSSQAKDHSQEELSVPWRSAEIQKKEKTSNCANGQNSELLCPRIRESKCVHVRWRVGLDRDAWPFLTNALPLFRPSVST